MSWDKFKETGSVENPDNPSTNDGIGDIDVGLIDQKMDDYDKRNSKRNFDENSIEFAFEPDDFLYEKNTMEYSWDEDKEEIKVKWPKHEGFVVNSTSQLALDNASTEKEYNEIENALEAPIPEDIQEKTDIDGSGEDISAELEFFEDMMTNPESMFDGDPNAASMEEGKILWRYGNENGYYLTDEGTPIENVSLPYDAPLHRYRVEKSFDYIDGKAAPAFDKPGGGKQYLTGRELDQNNPNAARGGRNIAQLVKDGYLIEVDANGKTIPKECDKSHQK